MSRPERSRRSIRAAGRPAQLTMLAGLAMLVLVLVAALAIGRFPVGPVEILRVLLAPAIGPVDVASGAAATVIWNVRLPRVLAALLVGAALASAGAVYQGLFRNPLVSPDILGVSTGASLGAILGILLSQSVLVIQGLAFLGGIAAVTLVTLIGSAIRSRDPVLVLVLAGVAIGALLGALISLLKILADPYDQLPAITFWLLGSLASVTPGDAVSILPAILLGVVPMALLRWRMNVLTLDDEEARALGVETRRLRILMIAAATLMTAAAVSISGIVGWVGLLVPHVARMLVGPDFARLLPASLMLGGGYLVVVDTLARSLAVIEMPLGILTAAIGAPFFLWLLVSARAGWR